MHLRSRVAVPLLCASFAASAAAQPVPPAVDVGDSAQNLEQAQPGDNDGPAEAPDPPPTPPPPANYPEWQGSGAPPPSTAPPPQPPPPEVPPPLYSRRPVELLPQIGLAIPHCEPGEVSSERCDGVKTGAGIGFYALWRVSPYFAWGGGFDIAAFRYDPPKELNYRDAGALAVSLQLLARAYFLDEGSVDPYLELGLGGAALGTSRLESDGQRYDESGAGPAVTVGGGVDFFLSRRLKLGPAISLTRVFIDKIRRCREGESGDCDDLPKDEFGQLNAFLRINARLTILLGDEL